MRHLLLLLATLTFSHAVVSIAPVEIGKKPGISGKTEVSFETKRGNTETDQYSVGVRAQYDDNATYVTWGELSAHYAEASGAKNTNNTYAHIRYIHKLYDQKNINYEAFVQSETNEFTKVEERFLLGGGVRFHILDQLIGNTYAGIGGFYEHIDYTTGIDSRENNVRANIYIAYTRDFGDNAEVSYAGYYQPKVNDSNDYLLSNGLELEVLIYEKMYLAFKISYNIDSKPAKDVKRDDFSQTTSFVYKF